MIDRIALIVLALAPFMAILTPVVESREQPGAPRMELAVSFDMDRSLLRGTARLDLPAGETIRLLLPDMTVTSAVLSTAAEENRALTRPRRGFILVPAADLDQTLLLSYEKTIENGFQNRIAADAIVLTRGWHPLPDRRLIFSLEAGLPDGFVAVSESDRLPRSGPGETAHFSFSQPVYGLTFAAAPYDVQEKTVRDGLKVYTYFFPEDGSLAPGYLEAAVDYILRYEALIGPFPFNHYVIAANVMPTGYGLPTFTLIGRRVLRLPFIKSTSLGHEILHSWFGNNIEVASSSGNWAEGLTTYLADLAYRVEAGEGAQARREIIQRFLSYVEPSTPPLREFRGAGHERTATRAIRAVGYGRSAMLFEELRERVGAGPFERAIAQFYQTFSGGEASWRDIQAVFEAESESDLSRFFRERLDSNTLPELDIEDLRVSQSATETTLSFTINQRQDEPVELLVPITVETVAGDVRVRKLIDTASTPVSIAVDSLPARLVLDPDINLMRRPSAGEAMVSWSQILGADDILVVVADEQSRTVFGPFLELAADYSWEVADAADATRQDLLDRTVVFLGTDGELVRSVFADPPHPDSGFTVDLRNNPFAPGRPVALLSSSGAAETAAAASRLRHYGTYRYLHFSGGRAVDTRTDQFSPGIAVDLRELPSGQAMADVDDFEALLDTLARYRVIYLGETHTSRADHLLQQMIIEALHSRVPELAIGMEMFPRSSQPALDAYIAEPGMREADFLARSRYFEVWNFDYRLFRPIFAFARKHGIPVLGLNVERDVTATVFRSGGSEALSEEQRRQVPPDRQLDLPGFVERLSASHRMHVTAQDATGGLGGFIEAQALWDETMAESVVRYLEDHPAATMVVLAGSQHTRKDSGIPPRVARRLEVTQASVLNLATTFLSGRELARTADYLFMLEAAGLPPQGKIGVVLEDAPDGGRAGLRVTALTPGSNAAAAGLRRGDLLTRIDGEPVAVMLDVRAAMLDRLAGDTITIGVERTGADGEASEYEFDVELFEPERASPHP